MKISNIASWVSGFSVGIFVCALSLVMLGALSSSFLQGGFSGVSKEDFSFITRTPSKGPGYPPVFAYWISGSRGENRKILRLLKAVYHPRNRYLLHLDAGSSDYERRKLALSVQSERVFRAFGNVDVVGCRYPLNRMGASALAATLHAAAMLLKISRDWDWFITLSTSDYPVMTQDDLLHAFTFLPRDLNFIHYSNKTGWKEEQITDRIVVDPNLHLQKNTPIFNTSGTRDTPDAFKVFRGSSWVILTRTFMDYLINGSDNLPRTLLMYFTNVASPIETYFHTVLCNSPEFQNTIVDNNLRYVIRDTHCRVKPHLLNISHYKGMLETGAAFARWFGQGKLLLRKIDEDILRRSQDGLVPGKWCSAPAINQSSSWEDINTVEPSPYGVRFGNLLSKLAVETISRPSQCNQQ